MSIVTLSGWLEDIEAAVPLLPTQGESMLRAYKVAVTTGGLHPEDKDSVTAYIQRTAGGGIFLVKKFYDELKRRAEAGTVPYDVFDPSKSFFNQTGKSISTIATETAKTATGGLRSIAIIAVVGLAGYLLLTGTIRLPKAKG
jgi:hypothetical protein